ncbi:MAG: GNAT family N-acetyltransferase [Alphaproteobacteria bacterium]|nr:GNAT family N-acetyltransferase [Alphaproteobacteria bacterium]
MGGTDATALVERALRAADAAALVPLSAEAGWNQVAADWRVMLETGAGFGIAEASGRYVASALTYPVRPGLRWISMVLTAMNSRRRGFGTRLLRRCVDAATADGGSAGLDATELGRPLYATMGFRELYRLSRWHLDGPGAPVDPPPGVTIRPALAGDAGPIAAFDAVRSAMQRQALLAHLLQRMPAVAHVAESGAGIRGFVLGRGGRFATQIGPIVADDERVALALLRRAADAAGPPFLIDVPDRHAALRGWLEAAGANAPRGFWRMVLGEAGGLADSSRLFAIAGPELG